MAKLKAEDRTAIAAYLKSLPPLPDAVPKKNKATDKGDEEEEGGGLRWNSSIAALVFLALT